MSTEEMTQEKFNPKSYFVIAATVDDVLQGYYFKGKEGNVYFVGSIAEATPFDGPTEASMVVENFMFNDTKDSRTSSNGTREPSVIISRAFGMNGAETDVVFHGRFLILKVDVTVVASIPHKAAIQKPTGYTYAKL